MEVNRINITVMESTYKNKMMIYDNLMLAYFIILVSIYLLL